MRPELTRFLDALHAEGRAHDAGVSGRQQRRRNLDPAAARLLAIMVRAARPRPIVEVGTSNGYSTIWLADAARDVGARFVSVDLDPASAEAAGANLERAGLRDAVMLVTSDAGVYLDEAFDVIDLLFLDAERAHYPRYWDDISRLLRPDGGLIVADNALPHEEELAPFRRLIDAAPDLMSTIVPLARACSSRCAARPPDRGSRSRAAPGRISVADGEDVAYHGPMCPPEPH